MDSSKLLHTTTVGPKTLRLLKLQFGSDSSIQILEGLSMGLKLNKANTQKIFELIESEIDIITLNHNEAVGKNLNIKEERTEDNDEI